MDGGNGITRTGGYYRFFLAQWRNAATPPLMEKTEAVTLQSLTVRVESSGRLEPISTVNPLD
jgi:hypothetical protein